ncbi:hypothetical protein WJX77_004327 [Trebouxia sp. C0004]
MTRQTLISKHLDRREAAVQKAFRMLEAEYPWMVNLVCQAHVRQDRNSCYRRLRTEMVLLSPGAATAG